MTTTIARYDYPAQFLDPDHTLIPKIRDLLYNGQYILGDAVTEFETELAKYIEVQHAVGVNSGTDALILALAALNVGPGDEVITVTNSFHATGLSIVRVGATPIFVDCDPRTYLINLSQVERRISRRTKAIIVVHMFGQAVDMRAVMDLANRHELFVVEDCAQAIGARSSGRPVGSFGHAGCWSFAPSKNLAAAGDAGAITLNDPALAGQLRHFGQVNQNNHQSLGFNSRLDSVQALILLHKLPYVARWGAERARIASEYRTRLGNLPLAFQSGAGNGEHVYHLFQVETPLRDKLLDHLQASNVDAVIRYATPMHLQPAFSSLGYHENDLPVAERLAEHTLCLPLFPSMGRDQVDRVCESVQAFFG